MAGEDVSATRGATASLRREVEALVRRYEALGAGLFDDRVWPCDVGAIVLAELADRAGLRRRVVYGTYRHRSLRSYQHATGNDHTPPEPDGTYPEYHTWLVVCAGGEEQSAGAEDLLVDPNGELRGEPRFQLLREAQNRYAEFAPDSPWVELPPGVTAAELVADGWDRRLTEAVKRLDAGEAER